MKAYKTLDSTNDQTTLQVWKKYEKLMKEAIQSDHYFALQLLVEKENVVKGD